MKHAPRYEIEFDANQAGVAANWHGGQSSMLYAVASTGTLKLGTRRPHGITDDRAWFIWLANQLEEEASEASEEAARQAQQALDKDDKAELREEAMILDSIAFEARDAALAAEKRLWPFAGGLGRR